MISGQVKEYVNIRKRASAWNLKASKGSVKPAMAAKIDSYMKQTVLKEITKVVLKYGFTARVSDFYCDDNALGLKFNINHHTPDLIKEVEKRMRARKRKLKKKEENKKKTFIL